MTTLISDSAARTELLGEAWGRGLGPGAVILLTGGLGSGKTRLVRGIARGLETPARVQSPTFAIVNLYAGGRLPLAHLDLYRLESPDVLWECGVVDYLQPEGVAVIEWGERLFRSGADGSPPILVEACLPGNVCRVRIEVLTETVRRIEYEHPGA